MRLISFWRAAMNALLEGKRKLGFWDIVWVILFIVFILLWPGAAKAGMESVTILETKQSSGVQCILPVPMQPGLSESRSTQCTQTPLYIITYRKKDGTTGMTVLKSYPVGKKTILNFCGKEVCR